MFRSVILQTLYHLYASVALSDQVFSQKNMSKKPNETLSQLLKRKNMLSPGEALSIETSLLKDLKKKHGGFRAGLWKQERQICISPDDILILYEEENCQAVLQATETPSSPEFKIYLAPECFWDVWLPAGDVFSAGVILYQMITGRHPWKYNFGSLSDDPEEIVTRIFAARKTPPREPSFYNERCDDALDDIVLKALATDLEQRYRTAEEFLSALNSGKKALDTEKHSSSVSLKQKDSSLPRLEKKKGKGFDDVAGMNELKQMLYSDVISALKDKELYEKYKVTVPNGLLLYGPPGCGKTFISQKFAEEIDYNFVAVKPSDLASIYVHGTQEKIGQLFKEAEEKAPSIIFIDEVDAVLPSRQGSLYHSYASEVNEFLAQMTECHEHGIFIIAATNRPEKIDPAILRTGRMDKVVYVEPPDFEARIEMFRLYLKDRPAAPDIDLKQLAGLSENYVSSDIKFIVNEASRNAMTERVLIAQSHLEAVLRKTLPSISENQIRQYEAFKKARVFV